MIVVIFIVASAARKLLSVFHIDVSEMITVLMQIKPVIAGGIAIVAVALFMIGSFYLSIRIMNKKQL